MEAKHHQKERHHEGYCPLELYNGEDDKEDGYDDDDDDDKDYDDDDNDEDEDDNEDEDDDDDDDQPTDPWTDMASFIYTRLNKRRGAPEISSTLYSSNRREGIFTIRSVLLVGRGEKLIDKGNNTKIMLNTRFLLVVTHYLCNKKIKLS